jgi:hypothetical protein
MARLLQIDHAAVAANWLKISRLTDRFVAGAVCVTESEGEASNAGTSDSAQ